MITGDCANYDEVFNNIKDYCLFKFNVKTCYFSSRLSNERKEIAGKIKKKNICSFFPEEACALSVML